MCVIKIHAFTSHRRDREQYLSTYVKMCVLMCLHVDMHTKREKNYGGPVSFKAYEILKRI
jgi:hypothetical protein